MNLIDAINAWLVANLLLAATALLLVVSSRSNLRSRHPLSQRHLLHAGYALVIASLCLPVILNAFEGKRLLPAPVQLWAGDTAESAPLLTVGQASSSSPAAIKGPSVRATPALSAAMALAIGGLVLWLLRVGYEVWRTRRLLGRATPLSRVGRAQVYVSDEIDVPFSFWTPGQCAVVLPLALLSEPRHARMALRHEAQHHRQGDTRIVYLIQLVTAAFLWNPGVHLLARRLLAQQELACDEAVLRRHRAIADGYCHCLLWVAGAAVRRRELLQLGMAGNSRVALLARLGAVLAPPVRTLRAPVAAALSITALLGLLALSVAFAQPVADQRISNNEAQRMLRAADEASPLRAVLNEAVIHELNALLGTRQGRDFVNTSLERMSWFADVIAERLDRDALPRELLAVPFVESGYLNRPPGENPRHGAGLWMFIEPTARSYGLAVGPEGDGRLDVMAATDAAARYLMDMHARFGDWSLALLAYNVGGMNLDAAIAATGSRDPWVLADSLYKGEKINYLARVVATVLILADAQRLGRP